MTFSEVLAYLRGATSKDLFEILEDLHGTVSRLADKIEWKSWILFLVGAVLAVVIGFFGYKMIKLLTSLAMGGIGYFVGVELFRVFDTAMKADGMPDWIAYIMGAVVAILFLSMGYIKFSYVVYTCAGVLGYAVVMFYSDSKLLALGGALITAMLSVILIRTFFISVCSFGCGVLTISMLGGIFPKVEMLQLESGNWIALCLALAVGLLYAVVQFIANRHCGEEVFN